jgi:uncharacterized protein (DUF2336 family)
MLYSLLMLAAETSPRSRRRLLHAVTDLFFEDPDPTRASKRDYSEIALRSLPDLDAKARQIYADEVAAEPTLPRSVANALAGDPDGTVARLVLRLSPILTDGDLIAIALNRSQAHLTAIAERARLSERVTDVLVERGNDGVLTTVGGNEGAVFSDDGFEVLLQRGRQELEIPRSIVIRSDLTQERAERVARLLVELGDESDDQAANGEAGAMVRQARKQRLEVTGLLADLSAQKRAVDEVLTMLAEQDRAYHLAQVIAKQSKVGTEHMLRALLRRDVSGIAIACRALDVGIPTFAAILALRGRRLIFAAKHIDDDLRHYAKIEPAAAERGMRFIRTKSKLN